MSYGAVGGLTPPSGAVEGLATAAGGVALGALALALIGLVAWALTARRLRILRRDQRIVLGGGPRDLVAHAAALERRVAELDGTLSRERERRAKEEAALAERLERAVSQVGVVRYDAMGELTGEQSSSVALLDARRDGVVLSSIFGRDHSRLYAKRIISGRSELRLSPEEEEALRQAGAGEGG